MSYELCRAGLLVGGPNGTQWAADTEAADAAIAAMRAGTNYDEDDYTVTPVYMVGYVGSIDAMPSRWPEDFDLTPRYTITESGIQALRDSKGAVKAGEGGNE